MKTDEKTREIILKYYTALGFKKEYDDDFFKALDEIYVDPSLNIDSYDLECEDGKKNLLYFLYFLEDMHKRYCEKGIDDAIFLDSAHDTVLWCDAWTKTKGELFLGELKWLWHICSASIIKLGRLEFCYTKARRDFPEYAVKKGDPILDVHIPAQGPLDSLECKKSFDMAREFYPTVLGKDFKAFVCHSWLLDPTLNEILKPTSNILAFQKMFDIVDKDESDALLGYIFRWKITRDELPSAECKSSLARTVKNEALSGRRFYAGLGIIKK